MSTIPNSLPAPGSRVVEPALTASKPETEGYWINHTMLQISNPKTSLQFYIEFMGMSLIFTLNTGSFVVYYLGYPSPDDKSPEDIAKSTTSRAGLLELIHVSQDDRASRVPISKIGHSKPRTFGHLGWVVPDVEEALKRAEKYGYKVLKSLDNVSLQVMNLEDSESTQPFHPNFLTTFHQVGLIEDPDGYRIELLPRTWKR